MEDVKIRHFLDVNDCSGSGYGYGSGSGSGYGYGYGYGSGYGDGSGSGSGSGSGYGDGYGSGSGSGYGDGDGISEINGHKIYEVDCLHTIFKSIHGNVARGFIVKGDLTLKPCYIVKGNNQFSHGETLQKAMDALREKMFDNMPEEERIAEFIKEHPDIDKEYDNQDLFEWHHHLTGSCLMGREQFVEDRGLSLDGETTVREFIEMTKNAYGGDVIKRLEEWYG